jgi:DNA-binding transcriptional MocR family regulator
MDAVGGNDLTPLQGGPVQGEERPRSASDLREADLVRDGSTAAGMFSRSAALLRAVSPPGGEGPASKVEPIEIHLSMPDGVLLPIDDLIAAHERVLRTEGRRALEYGGRQGDRGLREWLANDYRRREATPVSADNVVLTPGASGALASLCDVCIDPGDVILLERPTFSGSLRTLVASEAELVCAATDAEGIDPDEFDRTVRSLKRAGKRVKLLYTVPNFNNPTGALLPLARRERIATTCREAGILVVQDDAFADLSLGPNVPPSFWSILRGQGAVVVGTFSKTLAPGLRMGWVVAGGRLTEATIDRRLDLGVSPLTARAVADYCRSGRYERHVRDMIPVYRRKRDVLLHALGALGSRLGRWNVPQGGFSLWVELAPGVDAGKLQDAARGEGVVVAAGRPFFADAPRANFIRLCFSNATDSQLEEAVLRLSRALPKACT